ncbi:MAG: VWA domain-containing protein [Pyrinomonadaceae bacterium]|nr:VWA domain-containing protein [Pyrinomonadaceae bacterium]
MLAKRAVICLIFTLFVIAAGAEGARAQGVIVPRPCERCPNPPQSGPLPRSLPIKSINIETTIKGQVATTHVTQVFRNDTNAVLEGTYFFPIPESASIVEFAIWDGDRKLVGEVRSREEARRIYDEIVRRQRDPGLLEYAGKDLFQASIFPIPARSDKKLELTYTQVLGAQSGTVSYRYPLGTGKQMAQIGTVSGRIDIESKQPVRNIYSPSHSIDTRRVNDATVRLSFETRGGRDPQDFQLFYTLSDQDFGLSLLTYREPGRDGYFLLTISPKDNWSETEYAAKDVVFVLDTSGSMAEEGKMEKARAALLFGIRNLRPDDRYNVISFSGEERLMENGLINANETGRARGLEFVKNLKPTGGTNINGALLAAMRQFDRSDRPKLVVFMTDGLPTVGETNVGRIVNNAHDARVPGIRLFTFGVGYDVNTALLDKLASENRGVADYVEPKEDLEVKVSSFFSKVNFPVLTDLQLDMGGVRTDLVYPREMPDLFKGTQITLIGRYRNERDLNNIRIALSGKSGRENRTFAYENLRFPLKEEENDFLPRLWATRRVGWLMEQVRSNGEQKELVDEIVDLGTRYGIVTPYTSYLALEPNNALPAGNTVTRGRDQDRGSIGGGFGNGPTARRGAKTAAPMVAADATATTGAAAVQQSKRAREQQESVIVNKDDSLSSAVKTAGGKTFYLRDNVWADAEFRQDARLPETVITFGSNEYFDLLKRERRLAEYFALGEQVVVVLDGHVYRVKAATN